MPPQAPEGMPLQVLAFLGTALLAYLYARFGRRIRYKRVAWLLAVGLFGTGFLYVPVHDPGFGWQFAALMSPAFLILYLQYTFCPNCGAMNGLSMAQVSVLLQLR